MITIHTTPARLRAIATMLEHFSETDKIVTAILSHDKPFLAALKEPTGPVPRSPMDYVTFLYVPADDPHFSERKAVETAALAAARR